MSTPLQSGEGFNLEDCRAVIACIRRGLTRPMVALDCAVESSDQGESGIWRTDSHTIGGFDVKRSGSPHGNRPFMDSLVFS